MIVDDHSMVRTGLSTFILVNPDLELVGEARDGEKALLICERVKPDVILMDLVMPRMDGIQATRTLLERWPQIKIIALTSFQDRQLVQEALQAGAIGYLLKDVTMEQLADAIRAAYIGQPTLAPEAAQVLIQAASEQSPALGNNLTPREHEVLALMVEGLNNPQIGERLTISVTTVRTHVSNILSKLGVSNRAEAIVLAIRQGLVD
ncbi:MAG: response regulator transcription factor [Chloroflexota bacterium]|nr:MAG: response regulator transcription factor [Chloroflexota bacterium]